LLRSACARTRAAERLHIVEHLRILAARHRGRGMKPKLIAALHNKRKAFAPVSADCFALICLASTDWIPAPVAWQINQLMVIRPGPDVWLRSLGAVTVACRKHGRGNCLTQANSVRPRDY